MQKDLASLAKKMNTLSQEDRKYWAFQMAVCHDTAHHVSGNLSYRQWIERHERNKRILISCLSRVLTDQKENSQIKRGVEAFISASKDERNSFYKTIHEKEEPNKITTKYTHSPLTRKKDRIHE